MECGKSTWVTRRLLVCKILTQYPPKLCFQEIWPNMEQLRKWPDKDGRLSYKWCSISVSHRLLKIIQWVYVVSRVSSKCAGRDELV